MSTFTYTVTAEDLAELNLYRLRADLRLGRQMQALRFAIPLIILLASLGTVYLLDSDKQLTLMDVIAPCVLAVAMVVIFPRTFESNMRKRLAAQYKEGPNKDLVGKYTATISAELISQTGRGTELRAPWDTISQAAITDGHIFILVDVSRAIVIPRRGFSKANQYEQAKELVTKYRGATDSNKALTPR